MQRVKTIKDVNSGLSPDCSGEEQNVENPAIVCSISVGLVSLLITV